MSVLAPTKNVSSKLESAFFFFFFFYPRHHNSSGGLGDLLGDRDPLRCRGYQHGHTTLASESNLLL